MMNDEILKKCFVTQPPSRKSRSISRYFLGTKRSSIDDTNQDNHISRCLISVGIFDSYDRWTTVSLFRSDTTCRRLFILTNQNELIIGKYNQRQFLFKLKHRIDIQRIWFDANISENLASDITSLNDYDVNRSMILGWPLAENFIVEFDNKSLRDSWKDRFDSALKFWWKLNESNIEHVRIVIDQNSDSSVTSQHQTSNSFLIRKVIGIRPEETVRELIGKCIDAFHLRDPLVDNYVLFVKNNQTVPVNPTGYSSLQSANLPLIGNDDEFGYLQTRESQIPCENVLLTNLMFTSITERSRKPDRYQPIFFSFFRTRTIRSKSLENLFDRQTPLSQQQQQHQQRKEGHEYPYSIKMKHLKTANYSLNNTNRSFDGDDHLSYQSQYNSSSNSLNNVPTSQSHDFELRKRDTSNDQPNRKHRFFHKRKTKISQEEYHSSPTAFLSSPNSTKIYIQFFGHNLDDLIRRHDDQLPTVLMQLLEILYVKGPETTGIFRKVANTRSVKECIDKIERNLPLANDDLHPILVAGIFKHFLRSLPEPLFNSIQYDHWKKCLRLVNLTEKISFARKSILSELSRANYLLLKGFTCVLHRISEHADTNGMNPFNLGLCVSNSLFKTESTTITSGKQEADVMSSIVEFLIQNCSALFGPDVLTCIPDKHILVHPIANFTYPTASSVESLDEVESSPHLPVVNRSHDSGLAASDLPFNDDSSEISEHFRRHAPMRPNWDSFIACGKGIVLTSIIVPNNQSSTSVTRRRSSKNSYKPSKQFLEREKLTNPTDDSDEHSSIRSSTTTLHNLTGEKIKRSKSISRHSSLGSAEHKQQQQKQLSKESRRLTSTDVTRTSSFKQMPHSSDEAGDDDDEQNPRKTTKIERKIKPQTEVVVDRLLLKSTSSDQQDLDLLSEPLIVVKQSSTTNSSTPIRSTSFTSKKPSPPLPLPTSQQPIINPQRFRHMTPLISSTDRLSQSTSRFRHMPPLSQSTDKSTVERGRTFVHHADSRPFVVAAAIQMKPVDDILPHSHEKRRPCQRQNALRYKANEPERSSRISAPLLTNHSQSPLPNISRYQSIERRITPSPQLPMKSFSFDINHELQPSDISWSVREKAKIFEHTNPQKFSTGRENYV